MSQKLGAVFKMNIERFWKSIFVRKERFHYHWSDLLRQEIFYLNLVYFLILAVNRYQIRLDEYDPWKKVSENNL